ncbi:MAG: hypothetical protein PHG82_04850 [Candidatus Gracilibacteria bacterium]|nr:hypothetical protein [Candidatus Gracilibacteria bacterium]
MEENNILLEVRYSVNRVSNFYVGAVSVYKANVFQYFIMNSHLTDTDETIAISKTKTTADIIRQNILSPKE